MSYHYDIRKVLEDMNGGGKKKLILDTDTYNEIDDQFAITYAMLSPEIDLLALTAAPFYNTRSKSPEEGMEKSYEEMIRVRDLVDPEGKRNIPCYRGSRAYMKNTITPQQSEAAENIVRIVHETEGTVYIAVIGCFTNVASAYLMDPSIMEKTVVLMIGGNQLEDGNANDFNLRQDRNAARVLFECGVPLAVLPINGSTAKMLMTNAEAAYYLEEGAGEIGKYLCRLFVEDEEPPISDGVCTTRMRGIIDIASVAFLKSPAYFTTTDIVPAHTVDAKGFWRTINDEREMLFARSFDRNKVLSDFYTVVRKAARSE